MPLLTLRSFFCYGEVFFSRARYARINFCRTWRCLRPPLGICALRAVRALSIVSIQCTVDLCHRPQRRKHARAQHIRRRQHGQEKRGGKPPPCSSLARCVPHRRTSTASLPKIPIACVSGSNVPPHLYVPRNVAAPPYSSRACLLPIASMKHRFRRVSKKKSELEDSDLHKKRAATVSGAILS